NSGIVEARRDGKWMHYSIAKSLDENTARLLFELFRWMETQEGLRVDREKYRESYGLPENLAPAQPKPKTLRRPRARKIPMQVQVAVDSPEPKIEHAYENRDQYDPPVHHNELEDFLL
ncbi:MAG TPA: hypothetical protein VMZ26_18475, partial [Pyrinomonadaceae bacterium]|nr:hypothetical protein [Pyrinomonadaceae bacterium]